MSSELTDAQHKLLDETITVDSTPGAETAVEIGARHAVDSRHDDARALVRAGLASWSPPMRPFSRAQIRRAGTPSSAIRREIDSRTKIVANAGGREFLTANPYSAPEAVAQDVATAAESAPIALDDSNPSNPTPETPDSDTTPSTVS